MPNLQSLLMPWISRRMLSEQRLLTLRAGAESRRRRTGAPHRVHYFHQVDDPYCALTAQCLRVLAASYDIELVAHVVGPPDDAAAPDRPRLQAYGRRDAALLARKAGLSFVDHGVQPSGQAILRAQRNLVDAADCGRFLPEVLDVMSELWSSVSAAQAEGPGAAGMADASVQAHLQTSARLRHRLGHYLGATFFYEGEWYWGVDRLHHLELRLRELGACRRPDRPLIFAPPADLSVPDPAAPGQVLEYFVSLRSPYSAIVTPRVYRLAELTGVQLRVRYVLPMVMRGLAVPASKRRYIVLDTAREARRLGVAFGCINDPVGRPTERGLALMPWAADQGREREFLSAFMQGVWAQGIDAGSDRGLRRIVEEAGLPWAQAREALHDPRWRDIAERNRTDMLAAGLWGVPSFRVGDLSVWGQDRLWAVQDALSCHAMKVTSS